MPTTIDVKDASGVTRTVATLDAIAALVGEVQASPTALTLLDRLKTIASLLAGTLGVAGVVAVSNLPATQPVSAAALPLPTGASTEATLATLNGKVTAVNTGAVVLAAGSAVAGAFKTDQTTHGTTDLVAADITKVAGTAIDTNSGNKSVGTIRVVIATDQPAFSVNAAAAASEVHLGSVGGAGVVVNAAFTRPADTTAYAANDAVSNSTSAPTVLTFTSAARVNAGTGYVTKASLLTSQTTCTARFRLHLFLISPTAINDNAGCTAPLYADHAKYVGFIDFPAAQTGGGSPTAAFALSDGLRLHFKCDTADKNLYVLLQTLDAFTPANAQTFSINLDTEQD